MATNVLEQMLSTAIEKMAVEQIEFGAPEETRKVAEKIHSLLNGIASTFHPREGALELARRLVTGGRLERWEIDRVAAAISTPVREAGGISILETPKLDELLSVYEADAREGTLWRLTWHGLLTAYFNAEVSEDAPVERQHGLTKLRTTLRETWREVERQSSGRVCPDWIKVIQNDPTLLSDNPAANYAQSFIQGNTEPVRRLSIELGIPKQSWFWRQLAFSAVQWVVSQSDEKFKSLIVSVIELVKVIPAYRDDALRQILQRYTACSHREAHPALRDFVIRHDVWRNPKLRDLGIATSWHQVPDSVWRMVLAWVNERNLRDFFDILAARSESDHGRLTFWSRYLNQISWTRLVFGKITRYEQKTNEAIKKLLESEKDADATLTADDEELDAFMMKIGDYVFVEFSKTGNGAYGYQHDKLPFNLNAATYEGSTNDLKTGFHAAARQIKIIHNAGWMERTAEKLASLGIYPDRRAKEAAQSSTVMTSDQKAAIDSLRAFAATAMAPDANKLPQAASISKGGAPASGNPISVPVFTSIQAGLRTGRASGGSPTKASSPAISSSPELTPRSAGPRVFRVSAPTGADPLLAEVKKLAKADAKLRWEDLRPKAGCLWVYCDGRFTYKVTSRLKDLGFKWSESKKGWFKRGE